VAAESGYWDVLHRSKHQVSGTPTPAISSVTPNTGQQGRTLASVAIIGQNTSFVQGITVTSFGAGITVNSLTVNSATSATANITVQSGAALGALTVTVTTGTQVVSLVNGFTVEGAVDVVSFNVLFGSPSYNVAAPGATRLRLPWQITGIQVVFSRPIVSGNVNSLGGVIPTGFTGLGTNTLTWAISPLSLGSFATKLAGSMQRVLHWEAALGLVRT
jgi:hypothetical protein